MALWTYLQRLFEFADKIYITFGQMKDRKREKNA